MDDFSWNFITGDRRLLAIRQVHSMQLPVPRPALRNGWFIVTLWVGVVDALARSKARVKLLSTKSRSFLT
jgi:hypothetical protein